MEPAIGLNAVTHHGRNTLPTHFNMVMMRQTTIGFPLNAAIRQHTPTILCMTHHHSQQKKKCHQKGFHICSVFLFFYQYPNCLYALADKRKQK